MGQRDHQGKSNRTQSFWPRRWSTKLLRLLEPCHSSPGSKRSQKKDFKLGATTRSESTFWQICWPCFNQEWTHYPHPILRAPLPPSEFSDLATALTVIKSANEMYFQIELPEWVQLLTHPIYFSFLFSWLDISINLARFDWNFVKATTPWQQSHLHWWEIIESITFCSVNFLVLAILNVGSIQVLKFNKLHIFWEGHQILRNLHLTFDWHYVGQK